MKLKAWITALVLSLGAPAAMAAHCTSSTNWGNFDPFDAALFGNTFSSPGSYVDCYNFSLTSPANAFGGTTELDWSWPLDIDVTSAAIYSGHSLLDTDTSPSLFTFGPLGVGSYTLTIASTVSSTFFAASTWWPTGGVGYFGLVKSKPAQVPEPGTLASLGLGLAALAFVRRRRPSR